MTELDWWIHLKETNYSFETFSIYADWLEDSEEYLKAQVIKEIVDKEYRPAYYKDIDEVYIYHWWEEGSDKYYLAPKSCVIPSNIFRHLTNLLVPTYIRYKYYYSIEKAYQDLINAMRKAV